MLPLAVRQMLLGWHKSFVGKKREKKCGELLLYAFSGQFGRKEIVGLSRMRDIRLKNVNVISFVTFGCGLRGF